MGNNSENKNQGKSVRESYRMDDAGKIIDPTGFETAAALKQLHETVEALHQLHETEEELLLGVKKERQVPQSEAFVSSVDKLKEEEGLLVEKDGKLELGEEIKKSLIKVFKEGSESVKKELGVHEPRIFGAREKEDSGGLDREQEKKTAAAVVKIMEESKQRGDGQLDRDDESRQVEPVREEILDKIREEKLTLANAEILLVKGTEYALGLTYIPGMIPGVVASGKGKSAFQLIQDAFAMDLPVVEVPDWDTSSYDAVEIGKEIPEDIYPSAARALALIYRIQPGAHYVRFVKSYTSESSRRRKESQKQALRHRDALSVAPLAVEISEHFFAHREELIKQLDMTIDRLISELGLLIPPVKIRCNPLLEGGEFLLKIKDVTYDVGMMDVALEVPDVFYHVQGRFRALIYLYGHELLGYSETEALANRVKKHHPSLYRSLFPHRFTLGALRFVLRSLLKEYIPIKDMVTILETIDECVQMTGDPEQLVDYIRAAFSQYLTNRYKDAEGKMNVILLGPETERRILASIRESATVRWLDLDHAEGLRFMQSLGNELKLVEVLESPVVLMTSPLLRRFIRKITESSYPEIPVMAYSEVAPLTSVVTVGVLEVGSRRSEVGG